MPRSPPLQLTIHDSQLEYFPFAPITPSHILLNWPPWNAILRASQSVPRRSLRRPPWIFADPFAPPRPGLTPQHPVELTQIHSEMKIKPDPTPSKSIQANPTRSSLKKIKKSAHPLVPISSQSPGRQRLGRFRLAGPAAAASDLSFCTRLASARSRRQGGVRPEPYSVVPQPAHPAHPIQSLAPMARKAAPGFLPTWGNPGLIKVNQAQPPLSLLRRPQSEEPRPWQILTFALPFPAWKRYAATAISEPT